MGKRVEALIKCRTCARLGTYRDPDGLCCRCLVGRFDEKHGTGRVRSYYSVLSLKSGNVGMWLACKDCSMYKLADCDSLLIENVEADEEKART